MSGVTDPYQPLEASFALTRRLLEACLEFRQPWGSSRRAPSCVETPSSSAGSPGHWRARLPRSSSRAKRTPAHSSPGHPAPPFARRAGRCASRESPRCLLSPMIPDSTTTPSRSSSEPPGRATRAFMILLRLPAEVAPVFEKRLPPPSPTWPIACSASSNSAARTSRPGPHSAHAWQAAARAGRRWRTSSPCGVGASGSRSARGREWSR